MIMNMRAMEFGEARYIVLKELDTRGDVGSKLLKHNHELLNIVEKVCSNLEASFSPQMGGLAAVDIPNNWELEVLLQISTAFPSYMLQNLASPTWEDFLSAWVSLMGNYIGVVMARVENEEFGDKESLIQTLMNIGESCEAITQLVEIGISYIDLLNASRQLVDEMKTWQNSRPTSLKLSEAYLDSLNFNRK